MFSIDFTEVIPNVIGLTSSEPLDYFLYSDGRRNSKIAVTKGWEYWLFGVTDHVTLEGERFGFTNQVGILFGLKQNRRNILMSNS
jgi:hypothetical protein